MNDRQVYVAVCVDRHSDPVVRVFYDVVAATRFARRFMAERVAYPESLDEVAVDGYELFIEYDLESDHAFVVQRTVESI